jgi:HSP20 family protein
MAEAAEKVPVKTEKKEPASALQAWRPFETLRREMDRLFDDFEGGFWRFPFGRPMFGAEPFWRREAPVIAAPAVDVAESEKTYEITADFPGLSERGEARQRRTDNQGREAGEERGEEEGLSPLGTALWRVRTQFPRAGER